VDITPGSLEAILFIDIETVPCVPSFDQMKPALQEQWIRKARYLKNADVESIAPEELFSERAGIYSEFAKIVCIGMACFVKKDEEWKLLLKSVTGDDEHLLLQQFSEALQKFAGQYKSFRFCGHNIKEFDMPFICRRMVINGIPLPESLSLAGKKPWEVAHLDTLELWRFGDHKHYTSLALLAAIFDIPSPKDDIDGSMVSSVYWNDHDLARISKYCLQDVVTAANVYLRFRNIRDMVYEVVYL
jgi:3'-5' exonuclease